MQQNDAAIPPGIIHRYPNLQSTDLGERVSTGVARELTSNGGGILTQSWSGWTMSVRDEHGTELFSLTMSDFGDGPEQ